MVWGIGYKFESTEPKGAESRQGMFKGAVSWLSFMILLCTLTAGAALSALCRLRPHSGGRLGGEAINLTYRGVPPVAAGDGLLSGAGDILGSGVRYRRDRRAFEDMLAAWLAKIWVEFKLLFILLVLLFTMTIDMYHQLYLRLVHCNCGGGVSLFFSAWILGRTAGSSGTTSSAPAAGPSTTTGI